MSQAGDVLAREEESDFELRSYGYSGIVRSDIQYRVFQKMEKLERKQKTPKKVSKDTGRKRSRSVIEIDDEVILIPLVTTSPGQEVVDHYKSRLSKHFGGADSSPNQEVSTTTKAVY